MTREDLDALRSLARAGDRDAELVVRAGDVQDLIDELDAAHRLLEITAEQVQLARFQFALLAMALGGRR